MVKLDSSDGNDCLWCSTEEVSGASLVPVTHYTSLKSATEQQSWN